MQLHALLSLPTFREFRLIAGADGLQREVGNVDILEYEGFTQNYAVFSENDFVLTSLFFAKDDPARSSMRAGSVRSPSRPYSTTHCRTR